MTALLASGTTILCDRYYHSGIVYSAAKQNPALSLHWARAPEVGLPRPDLVVYLDLEESVAKQRGGWGGEVYEKAEMQKRVRELFWGLSLGRIGLTSVNNAEGAQREDWGAKAQVAAHKAGLVAVDPTSPIAGPEVRFRQEEEDLHVIDASTTVENVSEKVWEVVRPRIEAVERGEVGDQVRRVG
jgi:dTMP kinase